MCGILIFWYEFVQYQLEEQMMMEFTHNDWSLSTNEIKKSEKKKTKTISSKLNEICEIIDDGTLQTVSNSYFAPQV